MSEENKSARPLPANYVTILDLQQRWLKQQQQQQQQQQEEQAEQKENQQVQTQEKQQQPPPTPIEANANADRNPKPSNRNPNPIQRRNNYQIKMPLEQKPSDIDGSVTVAVVNEIASPDLEMGEQDAKKRAKQWKKKERRKMKKKEKAVPEAAEIVCGLAEISVNGDETKSCSDEIRCNSRLVNAAKEKKEEVDRCEGNAVKERRGGRGGRREVARRPDWRNSGSVVRYDRRMGGGGGGSGLVWVKKTQQA